MAKIPATVEILTFNVGATLARTLASVADFEDILVLDGGSADGTLAIARAAGARVVPQADRSGPIINFAEVRNKGLRLAWYHWFLFIDSDEYFTPELAREIRAIVADPRPAHYIWKIPRTYVLDGTVIDCATTYPNTQVRFFHREHVQEFVKAVHERIQPNAGESVGILSSSMRVPLPELGELKQKLSRYLTIEAQRLKGVPRADTFGKILHTLKALAAYTVRLPRVLMCRGTKLPLAYEWPLHQAYNARLLWLLVRRFMRPSA